MKIQPKLTNPVALLQLKPILANQLYQESLYLKHISLYFLKTHKLIHFSKRARMWGANSPNLSRATGTQRTKCVLNATIQIWLKLNSLCMSIYACPVWSAACVLQHLDRCVQVARLKISADCSWPVLGCEPRKLSLK